jgi:dephospho-CoA kinase
VSADKVIALVGLAGSGKSEAGKVLESLGYTLVYFGGAVMEELARRGLDVTPENERFVREDLRRLHGMAAMAILKLPQIQALRAAGKKVAIDGLYSFAEYEMLKSKLGNALVLLAIHTPRELRYDRLGNRPVRPLTREQVDQRDFFEIKNLDKGGPIAIADAHVINDSDPVRLQEQVRVALQTLISQ